MNYKRSYAILLVFYFVGLVMIFGSVLLNAQGKWGLIGFIIMAIGFFQSVFFFRCPRCGMSWVKHRAYLPRIPHHCPFCGEFIW